MILYTFQKLDARSVFVIAKSSFFRIAVGIVVVYALDVKIEVRTRVNIKRDEL